MSKIIFFLFSLVIPTLLFSQTSPLSYQLNQVLENTSNELTKRSDDVFIHIVVKGNVKNIQAFLKNNSGTVKYQYDDLMAIRFPEKELGKLLSVEGIVKAEFHNNPFDVMDETALRITSADSVHAGGGILQQAYTGKNVVVGIIDSGIDPTHPDFKNDDGTTRILAFWDQNDFGGSLAPYGYGKEYTASDIDAGLMANYLDTTYDGHGTAVTGMAAGGGKARRDVKGTAPEADIVAVGVRASELNYVERTPYMLKLVDAINYIFKIAENAGKPAVVNLSLGGIEGSHDGQDLPTQLIEKMLDAKNGRAVVVSVGNAGSVKHHVQYEVNQDTAFTWFRSMYSNSEQCKRDSGAYMSFYGDELDIENLLINISAENRTPCCTADDETGFRAIKQTVGQPISYTLTNGSTQIGVVTTFLEKIGTSYGYFVEIKSKEMSRFWRISLTGTGKVDGWAGPANRRSCNSDFIYNPLALGSPEQTRKLGRYVEPDLTQNIGSAYACSEKVITVGAYNTNTSMLDVDSVLRSFGGIQMDRASFSSIGPTRTGIIKPDLTGPGSRVFTAQASQVLTSMTSSNRSDLHLGGMHSVTDGTSFSSPAVAGIIALYLEKHPNANYADIKQALLSTTDQDAQTGTNLPNNENGYGRVNAYQMLLYQVPAGILEFGSLDALVYPNPTSGYVHVELSKELAKQNMHLTLTDIKGTVIMKSTFQGYQHNFELNNSGIYFLNLRDNSGKSTTKKIVVF